MKRNLLLTMILALVFITVALCLFKINTVSETDTAASAVSSQNNKGTSLVMKSN